MFPATPESRIGLNCCPRCHTPAIIASTEPRCAMPCWTCELPLHAWSTPDGWHVFSQKATDQTIALAAEKLGVPAEKITPMDSFQDLGADSLDVAEIIMELEGALDIHLPSEEADAVRTVGDVIGLVDHCLARKNE